MENPYEKCPVLENENYLLRLVEAADAPDLLCVYSVEKWIIPSFAIERKRAVENSVIMKEKNYNSQVIDNL